MKIYSRTKFHKSILPSIILFFLPAQAVVMALVEDDQQMVVVLRVEVEVVEDTKKNLPLLSFARPDLGFLKMVPSNFKCSLQILVSSSHIVSCCLC